jgi:ketosteroid isomerase-like protein
MFRHLISFVAVSAAEGSWQDTLDHHNAAFGKQDLDEIVKDYSRDAVINLVNWVDGSLTTYHGQQGVRAAFAEQFASMSDPSDLEAPVVQVDESRGTAFIVWKNQASGYRHGTDSIMADSSDKIVSQHIVVSKTPGTKPAAGVAPRPGDDRRPLHDAWDNHFRAFGNQNVDDILLDYAKDAKINVYNLASGTLQTFIGHSGVRECFQELFHNMHDLSDLRAPIQIVAEVKTQQERPYLERPGKVLLVWSNPASGYMNATDTFISNKEGKFVQQNVVVDYRPSLVVLA